MSWMKRWTVTMGSRLDQVVCQIENQEAVAGRVLSDVRRDTARAKVQLARLRKDGRALRARLDEARATEQTWRDRARRLKATDEAKAIACLRRAHAARRDVEVLGERLAEHEAAERTLSDDVRKIEERLCSLVETRNVMRLRETRARARQGLVQGECRAGDVDEVFDRWDARVTELELASGCGMTDAGAGIADELEEALGREEEAAALRAELEAMDAEDMGTPDDAPADGGEVR
jgi:phage shock protein A